MRGHLFHLNDDCVADWGGFGYDLQDGFYQSFMHHIPNKMKKQQHEFIHREMTGPILY